MVTLCPTTPRSSSYLISGWREITIQVENTKSGIGRTTFLVNQPGTLEIRARSDRTLTSTALQVDIPNGTESTTELPTQTMTAEPPTQTSVPTSTQTPEPTPAPMNSGPTSFNEGGAFLAEPLAGERVRPDGGVVRWRLSVPRELGPERPPFLIEHDPAAAEWTADDRVARASEVHPIGGPVRLTTLELPITDLPGTIAVLMRTVRIGPFRPSLAGGGARDTPVGGQTLRLRPQRAEPPPSGRWPRSTSHPPGCRSRARWTSSAAGSSLRAGAERHGRATG